MPPRLRAAGVTSRELDVLSLLDRGPTNAAISERLFLSPRTVETHVANLLASRARATGRSSGNGWRRKLRNRYGSADETAWPEWESASERRPIIKRSTHV